MRLKVYLFALLFMAGLVVIDGYQDTAEHHDVAGSSICQANCTSHIVFENSTVPPTITQTHPINAAPSVVTSLSITQSIFRPPKKLA